MKEAAFSRRAFLGGTAAVGAIPSVASSSSPTEAIAIHVPQPAGPGPDGALVELAVPFADDRLRWPAELRIATPDGKPVPAQMRPTSYWLGGTVRWLHVLFEAQAGPGDYLLSAGAGPSLPDLVREEDGAVVVNGSAASLRIGRNGSVQEISVQSAGGSFVPLLSGPVACDLIITRRDGEVFRASAAAIPKMTIDERGPLRASLRVEGRSRSSSGEELFDYILRWSVQRDRPEILLSVTWVNRTAKPAEQVRDIRVVFPFHWEPSRLVFGCQKGVYDGPWLKDWSAWVLQEDHDSYSARARNPEGRVLNMATGGANGERAPGWLLVTGVDQQLAVEVSDFWQKYPNELFVRDGEISIGLWPERANPHLKCKTLLPSDPFHEKPYSNTRYLPVMPHPYTAFVSPEDGCLDARQGVAMTQDIVLGLWAGLAPGPVFEQKQRQCTLRPVRGHLAPDYVSSTGALGLMAPFNSVRFPRLEQMFVENFGWLNRHIDEQKCYGKFDYGDFKYFTAGTNYLTLPGMKWGDEGEFPREGYWHNNERDPLRGLILYYFRTADPAVWERCRIVARHALDVDIRHAPHYGMWTHSYGHCYLALGEGGEPDHSWLLGLLHWAAISADPVAEDWVKRCGQRLAGLHFDFEQVDARTAAVFLHMVCQFYLHTGASAYLDAAQPAVASFCKLQNPNGSWPAYLANQRQPRIEGFVEHAVMALADYYSIRKAPQVRQAIDRALVYLFGEGGDGKVDTGESALALYALASMAAATGESRYSRTALKVLDKLRDHLNLSPDTLGRGDLWAEWGPNTTDTPGGANRPAQLLGQTRPLAPATLLAYGQPAMAVIEKNQSR